VAFVGPLIAGLRVSPSSPRIPAYQKYNATRPDQANPARRRTCCASESVGLHLPLRGSRTPSSKAAGAGHPASLKKGGHHWSAAPRDPDSLNADYTPTAPPRPEPDRLAAPTFPGRQHRPLFDSLAIGRQLHQLGLLESAAWTPASPPRSCDTPTRPIPPSSVSSWNKKIRVPRTGGTPLLYFRIAFRMAATGHF